MAFRIIYCRKYLLKPFKFNSMIRLTTLPPPPAAFGAIGHVTSREILLWTGILWLGKTLIRLPATNLLHLTNCYPLLNRNLSQWLVFSQSSVTIECPELFTHHSRSHRCVCFRELYYQVDVMFCDKNNPDDNGFPLALSLKMNYDQIATQVAEHLGVDPYMIQFFRNLG